MFDISRGMQYQFPVSVHDVNKHKAHRIGVVSVPIL